MTNRTPGPWAATTRQGSWDYVVCQEIDPNNEICQMFHDGTDLNEVGEANAMAVAECPNLIRALEATAGYLLNARIDIETGAKRATAIRTIDGGLKIVRDALAKLEPTP